MRREKLEPISIASVFAFVRLLDKNGDGDAFIEECKKKVAVLYMDNRIKELGTEWSRRQPGILVHGPGCPMCLPNI